MLQLTITFVRKYVAYCYFLCKCSTALYRNDSGALITAALKAHSEIPRSSVVVLLLSSAYLKTGRYSEAVDVLKEAIAVFPNDFQLNKLLVQAIVAKTGRFEAASPYVKAYLSNRPCSYRIPWCMALTLWLAERVLVRPLSTARYVDSVIAEEEEWARWAEQQLAELRPSEP